MYLRLKMYVVLLRDYLIFFQNKSDDIIFVYQKTGFRYSINNHLNLCVHVLNLQWLLYSRKTVIR